MLTSIDRLQNADVLFSTERYVVRGRVLSVRPKGFFVSLKKGAGDETVKKGNIEPYSQQTYIHGDTDEFDTAAVRAGDQCCWLYRISFSKEQCHCDGAIE